MSVEKLSASFAPFGFSIPLPAVGHVFSGFEYLGMILVTAIPFGIYDLVEALDSRHALIDPPFERWPGESAGTR